MTTLSASTTHDARFDDAWLKWGWAVLQANSLKTEVIDALKDEGKWGLTSVAQFDSQTNTFSVRVQGVNTVSQHWGLQLGDILHNFRSALDSAGWAAVARGNHIHTPARERHIAFPMNTDASMDTLDREQRRKVQGVTDADLAVVDWAQPYQLPLPERDRHILAILIKHNDLDKHRSIRPILLAGVDYKITPADIGVHDCLLAEIERVDPGPLETNTELVRIHIKPTGPHPDIKLTAALSISVFLEPKLGLGGFVDQTCDWVESVLGGFSQKPPDILERLGFVAPDESGRSTEGEKS